MSRRLQLIEAQRAALAYGVPSPDLQARVRALQAENAALRRQLGDRSARQPEVLAQHNETLRADSEGLRRAIRGILEADHGPKWGAGKRVLRALLDTDIGRAEAPTLRCVQHHITQIRKAGGLAQVTARRVIRSCKVHP